MPNLSWFTFYADFKIVLERQYCKCSFSLKYLVCVTQIRLFYACISQTCFLKNPFLILSSFPLPQTCYLENIFEF